MSEIIGAVPAFVVSVFVVLACALYALDAYLSSGHMANEPPIEKTSIPLIGHALGLVSNGTTYFGKLRVNPSKLMYTMRILPLKIYVVNSTTLLSAIQKAAKTISFRPLERLTLQRFGEVGPEKMKLCDEGGQFEGDGTFINDVDKIIRQSLMPGNNLDSMNLDTANGISKCLDDLQSLGTIAKPVDLYEWIRETITIASGRGVYGPEHPYRSKATRDAFWTFEESSPIVLFGLKRIVPKAGTAMDVMVDSFEEYFRDRRDAQGSALTRERARVFREMNFDDQMCARMEWSLGLAIFSNTVPSSFWTLYDIFSRPELLAEVRASLEAAVTTSITKETRKHNLDLAYVKSDCKILLSAFQEMQRTRGAGASVRKVMADTNLEGYVLKKGNWVQLPTAPVHKSTTLWGADAHEFNPHRFHDRAAGDRIKSTSLLAWGFAPHMCPARQFATTEILVLVALLVLRYDLVPTEGWDKPLGNLTSGIGTVQPPKKHINVRFVERKEWKGVWNVDVGASNSKWTLVAG